MVTRESTDQLRPAKCRARTRLDARQRLVKDTRALLAIEKSCSEIPMPGSSLRRIAFYAALTVFGLPLGVVLLLHAAGFAVI